MNKEDAIYDIAIIGAGPLGISTAVEAKRNGIENIIIFEKTDSHFAMIKQYYKDGKRVDKEYKGVDGALMGNIDFKDGNKEDTIEFFGNLLKEYDINVEYFANMGKVEKNDDGIFFIEKEAIMYKAKNVVIGVGTMGKPNKPSYKIPSAIKKQANFDTKQCIKGEDILVVGGGNSGLEYAYDLRLEHNVTLTHRGSSFNRANEQNINNIAKAQNDKTIKVIMNKDIKELSPTDNNKINVIFKDDSLLIVDRIIYAIGGTSPVEFLKACDIKINDKNKPIVDKNCQSNIKNLFVGGDLIVDKIGSISVALNHGYTIANYIKKNI